MYCPLKTIQSASLCSRDNLANASNITKFVFSKSHYHPLSTIDNILTTVIFVFLLVFVLFVPAQAASSTNVPIDNELSADMELWAAEGLIESQLTSIKPVVRSEAGRQIVMAQDKCNARGSISANCKKINDHYAKLFAAEIEAAKNPNKVPGSFVKPIENFSLSYKHLDDSFSMFNNEGIDYGQGNNAMIQFQSQAGLWKTLSFFVQPALIYNNHDYRTFYESDTELRLHRGYVKLNIANFEMQVGRDSLWWGPCYHGALLMSNNAQPFDMIKLSNPEPVLLPWLFSYLGPTQFNLIFSQLHDNRKVALANPFLYGLRLGIKPHPYLELGATHLVMFGGPGRRDMSVGDYLKTLYSNTNLDGELTDSNQQFAADIALTLPDVKKYIFLADGVKLYFEWGGEDQGYPPDRRAGIGGFALFKPFGLERAVLRGEYAKISPGSVPGCWYTHRFWPMFYDDRVFGHHAGTDSDDIFVEWSQTIEKFSYKLSYDRERSGIQTQNYTQFKHQYSAELGYRFNDTIKITLQYAYEDINNLGYVQDRKQKNHLLGTTVSFDF